MIFFIYFCVTAEFKASTGESSTLDRLSFVGFIIETSGDSVRVSIRSGIASLFNDMSAAEKSEKMAMKVFTMT